MANQETKKTLTVVDRSTKALTTAADGIVKAAADLQGIASLATGLAQDIEFKQNELDNLDDQLVAKQREQAAELRLRVREDEDKVLAELLKARGLVTKTPAEIKEVERQLAEALEDNQDAIDGAVQAKATELTVAAAAKLASIEANHKVEIAQYKANAENSTTQIQFLTSQNTKLEAQIEADRDARIEIAKAEAARQAVTVNTNGK